MRSPVLPCRSSGSRAPWYRASAAPTSLVPDLGPPRTRPTRLSGGLRIPVYRGEGNRTGPRGGFRLGKAPRRVPEERAATPAEVRAAVEALTEADIVRLEKFARYRIRGLGRMAGGRDHEDLL